MKFHSTIGFAFEAKARGLRIGSVMGCICSKGKSANEYVAENHAKKHRESKANRSSKHLGTSLSLRGDNDGGGNDATARLIPNSNPSHSHSHSRGGGGTGTEAEGSTPISSNEGEKEKSAKAQLQVAMGLPNGQPRVSRVYSMTRTERGAQVLAGWPSWLTAVAGEAISGWIPRRADTFEKLDKASSILSFLSHYFFIAC